MPTVSLIVEGKSVPKWVESTYNNVRTRLNAVTAIVVSFTANCPLTWIIK